MDKEYFQAYYQDHKKEIDKRSKEWNKKNPEARKDIKGTYYERNKERLKEYSSQYNKDNKERIKERNRHPGDIRIRRVLGIRIKEKKLKPFKKRISPELLARMEENTRINNKKIKFFTKEDNHNQQIIKELVKGGTI